MGLAPIARLNRTQGRVRAGADAGRAELHLALVRLDVGDELLEIVHRQVLAGDQDAGRFRDQSDRLEIGRGIVERLLVEALVVGVGTGIADQERVAVRRRLGDALAAGHAGRRADVFHDDRLAEQFAHALCLDARADVDPAAGRKRHHQGHGPGGPILRLGIGRERKQYRRSGDHRPVHVVLLVRRTLALIMGGIKAFFVAAAANAVQNASHCVGNARAQTQASAGPAGVS